ncbi:MAG: DEAD/DEAH box helicase [Chitinophagia bacterium]|nr:DEAD/DEAH box helicase [Chitinophagia bacterium]
MISFSSFPLREELLQALSDLGFESPTPIQQKVLPTLISEPKDIIGLAQTGTGKTAAYGLPLLHHVDLDARHIQGLVLSPTRELCMQIQTEMLKYGDRMRGLRVAAVYGGVPITGQIRDVRANPQVVVATPGRLIDLLERKAISLDQLQYVVLDEADEMLNMGFREDIELILKNTPEREHTWLFSATMSNDVRSIARRFMKEWEEFAVAAANVTNENIDHQYYVANHHNRFETLRRLLDFTPGIYGIIFTRTKQDAQEVSEKLMKMGYHVSPLHGDMDQKMRSKVMERFKNRSLQAIVATDVAARGIDVNDITHVINYELPDDPEVYTHRSGRTARAGKSGICMSIVSPKQISNIRQIERLVKQKFHKSDIPDGAEVIRKRLFFYMEQIANAEPKDDFAKLYYDSMHESFAHLDKDELIRKLIWLQLKDTIDAYQDAEDLNAGFESKSRSSASGGSKWTRLFINIGEKDGLNAQRLMQFITESTDIEPNIVERITVRELSSFFNVPSEAAEYIKEHLATKKFKNRKVRLEEAEHTRGGGGGGESRGYSSRPASGGPRFSGDVRSFSNRPGGGNGRNRSRS